MITDRDKDILRHIEKYKYCTLKQLEKIFFNNIDASYNTARRRILEIQKFGYVKRSRDEATNRHVYRWNDKNIEIPSRHRILVLDVLASLHAEGYDVQEFEVEKEWMNGKVRSDAFAIFTKKDINNNKHRFKYFVEVHLSNNPIGLEKYDKLYETGEVQEYTKSDKYPRILLITDRQYKVEVNRSAVLRINTKLDNFKAIDSEDDSSSTKQASSFARYT